LKLLVKRPIAIAITSSSQFEDLHITFDDTRLAVNKKRISANEWSLEAVPSGLLAEGAFSETISVAGIMDGGAKFGPVNIHAVGTVVGDYYAVPDRLYPAVRFTNEPARVSFSVMTTAPKAVVVESVHADDPMISARWTSATRNGQLELTVDFQSETAGERKFCLMVEGSDELQERFLVKVPATLLVVRR